MTKDEIIDALGELEDVNDAYERGRCDGFSEARNKWDWEQYALGLMATFCVTIGAGAVIWGIWMFIHSAAQP